MKKLMFLLVFFALSITTALAQKTFSGKVIGPDGLGLPGVNVVEKANPMNGISTDIDGNWTLTVPDGNTILEFTSIGMKPIEIAAKDAANLTMTADAQMLDDVIVVGYGTSTKKSFTGSATTVKADALAKKSVSSVTQALSGEVPGVNIVNKNGQPGSSADIYVRGVGSVNAGTAPLYVVDGVPYSGNINSINPNDIESTTLLKDAAATSIYGARGANGVIVINTKQGKRGSMKVSADFKYGVNSQFIPRHEVLTSPEEYIEMGWSGLYMWGISKGRTKEQSITLANNNIFGGNGIDTKYNLWKNVKNGGDLIDPATGKVRAGIMRLYDPELWKDEAFQSSNRTEANIQLSGGSDKIRAISSLGFLSDKGISKNSSFKRFTGRINVNMNPVEWLSTKTNIAYTRSNTVAAGQSEYSSTNLFTFIDNMPPIYPVYLRDNKGNKIKDPYYPGQYKYDYGIGRGYSGQSNGLATAIYDTDDGTVNDIAFLGNVNITILEGLTFENTYSGNIRNYQYKSRGNVWYGDPGNQHGTIYHYHENTVAFNFLSMLRYKRAFDDHHMEAFVAHEANSYDITLDGISKKYLVDPFVDDLTNALFMSSPATGYSDEYSLESYFAQVNYDYKNTYFVSPTIRRDGSSRFLNNKWGTFASIGLGWMVTNEEFAKNWDWLKSWKIKASYGTLGQQSGISYYSGFDRYDISPLDGKAALIFSDKGNPDLTWEKSTQLQFGTEFQIGNILDANIEYYYKTSTSLLYDRRVAPSNGYAIYKVNDGELYNTGIDIDLTVHALKREDAYVDFRINGGFLKNKMTKMPIDPATGKEKFIDIQSLYGRATGHSIYDYYIRNFEGVNPDNGLALYTMYYFDENNNNKFDANEVPIQSLEQYKYDNPDKVQGIKQTTTETYTDATLHYVGKSALPTVRGAFSASAGYKGFDFSVQFIYSFGGYGYDGVYSSLMQNAAVGKNNWHVDMRDRWMEKGQVTNVPRLNHGLDSNTNSTSTRFLTSNSFINLSNIRLGYTLPKNWTEALKLSDVNIWVSGDNLFLWSERDGYNPSTSLTGASSSYTYSPLSTISAGVRLSF